MWYVLVLTLIEAVLEVDTKLQQKAANVAVVDPGGGSGGSGPPYKA